MRGLLHSGTLVRADHPDRAAAVHGVVGQGEALFAYVQLATSALEVPGPVRLPGLARARPSRAAPVTLAGGPAVASAQPPPWLAPARSRSAAGRSPPPGSSCRRSTPNRRCCCTSAHADALH